jgi:hypothetical protein
MNLQNLKNLFADYGCQRIYVKKLSANDNSKNQVYFGGSFEILNVLPISEIKTEEAGFWNKERFKALIDFSWIADDGNVFPAPNSQLILYPKYPEVRFSGFLKGCINPPSELMTLRLSERLLFLSVTNRGKVLGYVTAPDSIIAREFNSVSITNELGVFKIIDLLVIENSRERLLIELKRIHNLDWIVSKRLNSDRTVLPCKSSNCGGYTLEAELGITPNGYSEPDFLGWEIKQFGVTKFLNLTTSVITLMTPEPTSGFYVNYGTEAFIRKYGYNDTKGRDDRKNFGGIHKVGQKNTRTELKMELIGFDIETGRISDTRGMIALIDKKEEIAASWAFSSLLLHWNRKHNNACFVPSLLEKSPIQKYKFGNKVILGTGTDFQYFLSEMSSGNIYYDPGIKMEFASTVPKIKKRSQFRIKSKHLENLYNKTEMVDVETEV